MIDINLLNFITYKKTYNIDGFFNTERKLLPVYLTFEHDFFNVRFDEKEICNQYIGVLMNKELEYTDDNIKCLYNVYSYNQNHFIELIDVKLVDKNILDIPDVINNIPVISISLSDTLNNNLIKEIRIGKYLSIFGNYTGKVEQLEKIVFKEGFCGAKYIFKDIFTLSTYSNNKVIIDLKENDYYIIKNDLLVTKDYKTLIRVLNNTDTYIEEGVEEILADAFPVTYNFNNKINFPSSLKRIEDGAIRDDDSIVFINNKYPSNLEYGSLISLNNDIKIKEDKLYISNNIKELSESLIIDLRGYDMEDTPYFTFKNNLLLSKDETILYRVLNDKVSNIIIPSSIKKIHKNAFNLRDNLETIELSNDSKIKDSLLTIAKQYNINIINKENIDINKEMIVEVCFDYDGLKNDICKYRSSIPLKVGDIVLVPYGYHNYTRQGVVHKVNSSWTGYMKLKEVIKKVDQVYKYTKETDNKYFDFKDLNNGTVEITQHEPLEKIRELTIPLCEGYKIIIPKNAFSNCKINKLIINKNVVLIEEDAFKDCTIMKVDIDCNQSFDVIKDKTIQSLIVLKEIKKKKIKAKLSENNIDFVINNYELYGHLFKNKTCPELFFNKDVVKVEKIEDANHRIYLAVQLIERMKNNKYDDNIVFWINKVINENYETLWHELDEYYGSLKGLDISRETFNYIISDNVIPLSISFYTCIRIIHKMYKFYSDDIKNFKIWDIIKESCLQAKNHYYLKRIDEILKS